MHPSPRPWPGADRLPSQSGPQDGPGPPLHASSLTHLQTRGTRGTRGSAGLSLSLSLSASASLHLFPLQGSLALSFRKPWGQSPLLDTSLVPKSGLGAALGGRCHAPHVSDHSTDRDGLGLPHHLPHWGHHPWQEESPEQRVIRPSRSTRYVSMMHTWHERVSPVQSRTPPWSQEPQPMGPRWDWEPLPEGCWESGPPPGPTPTLQLLSPHSPRHLLMQTHQLLPWRPAHNRLGALPLHGAGRAKVAVSSSRENLPGEGAPALDSHKPGFGASARRPHRPSHCGVTPGKSLHLPETRRI